MRMYGLTRATTTLLAAAVAGFLIWLATQFSSHHQGGYWAIMGVIAGAGLAMALSQLLGGWTKWGLPRLSVAFFLFAFVPIAIVCLWVIVAGEPGNHWLHRHVLAWSNDIHVRGLVTDLLKYSPVLAFGTGLVFGFCFDTSGRVARGPVATGRREVAPAPVEDRRAADEPTSAERTYATRADGPVTRTRDEQYVGGPPPEPPPRTREPE
jgi:MFS family permease